MKRIWKRLRKKAEKASIRFSELVVRTISTWTFVVMYTVAMGVWMTLHQLGVLSIDGPDFIKWNLWLSYFAGIQASIVLMSTERQSRVDRIRAIENREVDDVTLKITKLSHQRIKHLEKQIELLEDVIGDVIEEKNGKR